MAARLHRTGLTLVLLALLMGCARAPTLPPTVAGLAPLATATPDDRPGGRLNVRLSHAVEAWTPLLMADDPEAGWVLGLLYPGLTRLDDRLLPRPDLA